MNKIVKSVNSSHAEATLKVPASEIWPHIVNPEEYLGHYKITRVSGEPGEVGEVARYVSEYPVNSGYHVTQYYTTLVVVPERLWIAASSLIESSDPMFKTDDGSNTFVITLNELDGKTRMTASVVKRGRSTEQNQETIDTETRLYSESATKAWDTYFFPRIRTLVER